MTQIRRCGWCRAILRVSSGRGRPRKFCSQRCRQWDWVARQRARELELSEGELVVARTALDALHDDLYVLSCAVADIEQDLAAGPGADEVRELLEWLLSAARPLRDRSMGAAPGAVEAPAPESLDRDPFGTQRP
jgi:endogenous inhibitor of DNA gyrase (YacG/DUF329 family)